MTQLIKFIIIFLSFWLCLYSYSSMAKLSNDCLYRVVKVQTNDTLTVRDGPGVKYNKITQIPSNGTYIEVVGYETKVGRFFWVPIEYEGIRGWVNSFYIKQDCPINEPAGCSFQVVNVDSNDTLSVRQGAGIRYKKIYNLSPNATGIEVTGRSKKAGRSRWLPIKYKYVKGWVNRRYIQEEDCL